MGFSQKLLTLLAVIFSLGAVDRAHITFLMQSGQTGPAIGLYEEYKKELGRHDFETLQQLGMIILESGIRSEDAETQLLSIYGASIAGVTSSIDILEQGIRSPQPETQQASLQFLARLQDDRCDEILTKAMSSNYLPIRMEAGYHLAMRKHRKAAGMIEALMYKIPNEFWFYFPQFFALIGTADAMTVLRHLIEDRNSMVRVEAILSAARFGRDDLLPKIRAHATHPHHDEQEACAAALGLLKDSASIPKLEKLSKSPLTHVQLAALRSLYVLGDTSKIDPILEIAKTGDIFAISMLADFPVAAPALQELLTHGNFNIRMNAALSLLRLRNTECLDMIKDLLVRDMRDLGFQPQVSLGHSMTAWKAVPSLEQHLKTSWFDLYAISLNFREQLLIQCLELPESDFLEIASLVFDANQSELIPLLVHLLENHQTHAAIDLLKKKAQRAGSPHIRAYCALSLYRMRQDGPYEQYVRDWLSRVKTTEMIRFRPNPAYDKRQTSSPYELTPEESSRLLIEAYQALAERHDESAIELILEAIREGHPKNSYVLAGLLIHSIQ